MCVQMMNTDVNPHVYVHNVGGADAEITPSMRYNFASDKTLSVEVLSELPHSHTLHLDKSVFSCTVSYSQSHSSRINLTGKQIMRMVGKQFTKKIYEIKLQVNNYAYSTEAVYK